MWSRDGIYDLGPMSEAFHGNYYLRLQMYVYCVVKKVQCPL